LLIGTLGIQQAQVADAARLTDSVSLFVALGGGWWNRPAEPAAASSR